MSGIYAPVMRALVVAALVLATATLMFVTVNIARASARMAAVRSEYRAVRVIPAVPDRPAARHGFLSS